MRLEHWRVSLFKTHPPAGTFNVVVIQVNIRKLAALDLHFFGPSVILIEFALGVLGPLVLGVLTLRVALRHRWPLGLTLFGAYLLSLGVNYIPLLLHAVSLVRSRSAADEIADELSNRRITFRKYRRQSLYLLVPVVVPIVAVVQQWQGSNSASDERAITGESAH